MPYLKELAGFGHHALLRDDASNQSGRGDIKRRIPHLHRHHPQQQLKQQG